MMKNAIVTGASGFVGRWLVRELLNENIYVIAVVRPDSHNRILFPQSDLLQVVECPMEEYSLLPTYVSRKSDCIFYHLAWDGVFGSKRMDLETQLKNVYASKSAVEAASLIGCSAFVGIGSIMEDEALAAIELSGNKTEMSYIYGEAKHFSQLVTKAVAAKTGIIHLWPVLTNVYGEFDYSSRFINTTLYKILRHQPLEFTSGSQLYDFVYIEDAVKALIAVGKKGKAFQRYLIGSGHAAPLRVFIECIGRVLAPEQPLYFGKIPYSGVMLSEDRFDIRSLIRDTGFIPRISFEAGIRRLMKWLETMEERFNENQEYISFKNYK